MKSNKKLMAAACAFAAILMSATSFAVNGTCKFNSAASTLNLTLDPSASSTVSRTASILYRCTKGTAPTFALASGSTSSATGGNLVNGSESIAYTFTSSSGGAGTGMGAGNDKTLWLTVSVDQANAANATPAAYTDTIAITLTP